MGQSSENSVTVWIKNLKAGDQAAAAQLWERYFGKLVQLARRRLSGAPRREADEEDVALSVFESLCHGAARGHFTQLTDRDDLWRLLLVVTRQKAVNQIRRGQREKRGGGQVRGESVFVKAGSEQSPCGLDQLIGESPTPEFLTQLEEEHQRLLGLLRDDTLRQIALWKLEGYTHEEIAAKLNIITRTVERKVKLIRETWAKEMHAVE